jgi:hypothetical protein
VPFAAGIKAARQPTVARTDEDRESFLRKSGLSKSETSKVVEAVYKILHLMVARCETGRRSLRKEVQRCVLQPNLDLDATSISTMVAGSDDPATLALARIASEAEIELSQVRTSERQG